MAGPIFGIFVKSLKIFQKFFTLIQYLLSLALKDVTKKYLFFRLPEAAPLVVDLLVELMGILASYNITVKELKMLFSAMKAVENKWVSILKYFSGLCFFQKRVNNDFKKNFFWKFQLFYIGIVFYPIFYISFSFG